MAGTEAETSRGSGVIHQLIRERAYEIWKREGRGSPNDNWVRAEAEIRAELEREAGEREAAGE